jgi:hypothetical protein
MDDANVFVSGGPTNTLPRYRPPQPGIAQPPPPPSPQYQQQHANIVAQQQQQQQQQSFYQQPQQSTPNFYQRPPPHPSTPDRTSYAARSAAAGTTAGPATSTIVGSYPSTINEGSHQQHDSSKLKPKPTSSYNHGGGESLLQAAEQTRLLHSATQKVTERAYHMQRAMESDDVCVVLENACHLLEELGDPNHGLHHKGPGGNNRGTSGAGGGNGLGGGAPGGPPSFYSSAGGVPPLGNYGDRSTSVSHATGSWIAPLTPKNYYELHMRIMDEMPSLEEYLLGLCHNNNSNNGSNRFYSASTLYETVQYCPRVVPRLYLQICMGAVSIRSGNLPVVQVMEELGEATKCVQCPVRGLFLRYYLLIALKDKLPDGTLDDDDIESMVEKIKITGEDEIAPPPPPPLPPPSLEPSLEILDVINDVPTSPPPPLPPPPPPTLPPPPPPTSDCPLSSDAPLFSDEPLYEEPETANDTFVSVTSPAENDIITKSDEHPSTQNHTESRTGTVIDSYEFILRNFLEMNRLWIRIQHMPGDNSKETKRQRERERNDLRILVGSNLNRLSQLDGISALIYGTKILPRILEEISSCRDPLAQAYLMDCIIHVFPNEYHLETLEVFLGVCPRLRPKVNLRTILSNMMERLLNYYNDEKLVNDEEDTNDVKAMMAMNSFDVFDDCVHRYFEARGLNTPPKDVIRLQGCLMNYALKIAPHNTHLISRCISQCAKALQTLQEQKRASMMGQSLVLGGVSRTSMEINMDMVAITELEKLLSVPLKSMGLMVLDSPDFIALLAFLPWDNRRQVAISMIKSVIGSGRVDVAEIDDSNKIKDVSMLEDLFTILTPLLRDEGPVSYIDDSHKYYKSIGGHGDAAKMAQIRQEQSLVAKLVHTLRNDDTDIMYQMLNVVKKHLQVRDPTRIVVSLPAIVFSALSLVWRVRELEFPEPSVVVNGLPEEVENVADLNQETAGVDEPKQSFTKKENQTSEDDIASTTNAPGVTIESCDNEDSKDEKKLDEAEKTRPHGTGVTNAVR